MKKESILKNHFDKVKYSWKKLLQFFHFFANSAIFATYAKIGVEIASVEWILFIFIKIRDEDEISKRVDTYGFVFGQSN